MMRTLVNILRKEFIQLMRTPALVVILILCPVITTGLIPYGLGGKVRLRVDVVDRSFSDMGRETVIALARSPYVASVKLEQHPEKSFDRMDRSEIDAIVTILEDGNRAIAADGSHSLVAHDACYFIESILSPEMESVAERIRRHILFVSCEDSTHFFMMAMIVLMSAIVCSCLATLSVVKEMETKVLEHLRSANMKSSTYVISKNVFFIAVAVVELAFALLLARWIFDLESAGPLPALFLLFLCFFYAMVNVGIAVASFGKTMVRSIYILVFLFLILILLSTMFAPLDNMSEAWAATRFINPFYWAVDGETRIMLKGDGLSGIYFHILTLTVIGSALLAVNILKLKKID